MSTTTSGSEHNMDILKLSPRLGLCEVCNAIQAKYTCPKCEIKSCCLKCVNVHKKELNCDGIRDRTKYIPLKKMTEMELRSDYCFLEECTRFLDDRSRSKIKRYTQYNKSLPPSLFRLRCAARNRGTTLKFLLQNFTKRQRNTSQLNFKTSVIHWRVEWCFPNAEGMLFVDNRCDETQCLRDLLSKYLEADNGEDFTGKSELAFYQSRGLNRCRVLLKAEGVKRCKNRFFELKVKKSLKDNLKGKTIVEYPVIYIIFKEASDGFDVIESDEDVEAETKLYQRNLEDQFGQNRGAHIKQESSERTDKQSKLPEDRKKKATQNFDPANFLFSDENFWNHCSSDSDGQVTEQESDTEAKLLPPKRIKTERE